MFSTAEEALETLRLATEAAQVGVWDFNVGTGELHWSSLAKSMFGITKPGALALGDFLERLHPEELERVQGAMQRALAPGGQGDYDIDYRVCRPSGEQRFVHAKGKAFFEGDEENRRATRFVGTLLDRTDQRLSYSALIQAEQMAATGRLAASIAHEINNPLEAVTNLLYLLRDEMVDGPGKEYLRQAEFELARVSEIAAHTLRFYRDPVGVTSVEIGGLTQSVLNLFKGRTAERGIGVEFRCGREVSVEAAQGEVRQVLVNLIGNALDAMPHGGRLAIRCRVLSNYLGRAESGVAITIADTGTGITPEVLKRVFEPFFTTKGSSGTGLGLWLTLGIVKKYGFQLHVRSRVGHGTVFRLFMPAPTQPQSQRPVPERQSDTRAPSRSI